MFLKQTNQNDSNLEVSEDDYNPEIDESGDSEEDNSESRSRPNF